jgi:hypothetical protein
MAKFRTQYYPQFGARFDPDDRKRGQAFHPTAARALEWARECLKGKAVGARVMVMEVKEHLIFDLYVDADKEVKCLRAAK